MNTTSPTLCTQGTTMHTIASQTRTILALAGLPKSTSSRSRITGAPLHTRGYEVRKHGDTQARVTWHPGWGRTWNHPDIVKSMDATVKARESHPVVRLRVTARHMDTLTVEYLPTAGEEVESVYSTPFVASADFPHVWDELRHKTKVARLGGVRLERSLGGGDWQTLTSGTKTVLRDAVRAFDGTATPGRFRLAASGGRAPRR